MQKLERQLSYANFTQLCEKLQLDEIELDAQIRAVLIGAVTLSPRAQAWMHNNFTMHYSSSLTNQS